MLTSGGRDLGCISQLPHLIPSLLMARLSASLPFSKVNESGIFVIRVQTEKSLLMTY